MTRKTYVAASTMRRACYDRFTYRSFMDLASQLEKSYGKKRSRVNHDDNSSGVHVIFTDGNWVTLT